MTKKSRYLSGRSIAPQRIVPGMTAADLIDGTFLAYNAGRLQEGCRLFAERMRSDARMAVPAELPAAVPPRLRELRRHSR